MILSGLVTRVAAGVVAAALLGGGAWLALERRDRRVAQEAVRGERLRVADSVIAELRGQLARADTAHTDTVRYYYTTRERVLASADSSGRVPVAAVVELADACEATQRTCERRAAAAEALVGSLQRSLDEARDLPNPAGAALPRVTREGALLWDVFEKAPLVRVGASLRLFGPAHLHGEGEARYLTDSAVVRGALRAGVVVRF